MRIFRSARGTGGDRYSISPLRVGGAEDGGDGFALAEADVCECFCVVVLNEDFAEAGMHQIAHLGR